MDKEEILYNLIQDLSILDIKGFGVHESSFVDCDFPDESYGYRVYNIKGYCFDITREKSYKTEEDEENKIFVWYYLFHEGSFDGFKTITIDKAIDMVRKALNTGRLKK
jgi:hypothetical protein